MSNKKTGVWRKPQCKGIACPFGLYYDVKSDRTYCYVHGWVMNGNIEEQPIQITRRDFNAI